MRTWRHRFEVTITRSAADPDALTLNASSGNDWSRLIARGLEPVLTINGGADNELLVGSRGDDRSTGTRPDS